MRGKQTVSKEWVLSFLCVAFARGLVFRIPYLRSIFYDPMMVEFGLSHTQIGMMLSVYSTIKTMLYIPCGIIGDKVGTRKTLTLAMGMMAALSFWYAMSPSYAGLLVIHGVFGIAVNFAVPAMIKALRYFGGKDAQGRAFGFAETCRGVASLAINFIALWIFQVFSGLASPMRPVLMIHAAVYAFLSFAAWKTCPDTELDESGQRRKAPGLKDYIRVMKMPVVWALTLLVMSSYCLEILNEYSTPYMTYALGMSAVTAGVVASLRSYAISLATGPVFGIINDKYKSYSNTITYVSLLQMCVGIGLVVLPAEPGYTWIGIILIVLGAVGVDGFASTQFCTFEECSIPVELTGTVTTVVSTLGYTPDIWLTPMIGSYLDSNDSPEAYHHVFMLIILFAVISIILSRCVYRISQKKNA